MNRNEVAFYQAKLINSLAAMKLNPADASNITVQYNTAQDKYTLLELSNTN